MSKQSNRKQRITSLFLAFNLTFGNWLGWPCSEISRIRQRWIDLSGSSLEILLRGWLVPAQPEIISPIAEVPASDPASLTSDSLTPGVRSAETPGVFPSEVSLAGEGLSSALKGTTVKVIERSSNRVVLRGEAVRTGGVSWLKKPLEGVSTALSWTGNAVFGVFQDVREGTKGFVRGAVGLAGTAYATVDRSLSTLRDRARSARGRWAFGPLPWVEGGKSAAQVLGAQTARGGVIIGDKIQALVQMTALNAAQMTRKGVSGIARLGGLAVRFVGRGVVGVIGKVGHVKAQALNAAGAATTRLVVSLSNRFNARFKVRAEAPKAPRNLRLLLKVPLIAAKATFKVLEVTAKATLNTTRFLGTVFFGKGKRYFINRFGDAALQNITVLQKLTAPEITSERFSAELVKIKPSETKGTALEISYPSPVQVGDLTGIKVDFGSIVDLLPTYKRFGVHIKDSPETTATDYGIYVQGTNWDYAGYFEDDVYIGGKTEIGGNTEIAGTLTVAGGDATLTGRFIPSADDTYDIGENVTPLRWRTGYFGTSIVVGGTTTLTTDSLSATGALNISASSGTLSLTGDSTNDIDIANTGAAVDIDSGTLDILTSGAFSIDGTGASNVSVTSGDLTLSTITSGNLLLISAGDTTMTTSALDINNTGAVTIGTDGSEQNITFETANFDVNSTGAITIDGTDFTYTPTGTYTVDAGGTVNIDSDALGTFSGAGINITSDGANAITVTYAATGGTFELTDGTTRIEFADDGSAVFGDDGATTWIDGSTITLSGNTVITGTIQENLPDNTADALDIQQGADNYINVSTLDGAEAIQFGNAATDPDYSFLGTGTFTISTTGSILADSATTVSFDAVTDLDLGTSNAARAIDIGTGTGVDTINIGTGGTNADDINLGGLATSTIDILGVTSLGDGGAAHYAQFSATGDLTFVGSADTITGPAGGALTVQAGASQALTLTANAASTWSTSSGILTLQGDDGVNIESDAASGIELDPFNNAVVSGGDNADDLGTVTNVWRAGYFTTLQGGTADPLTITATATANADDLTLQTTGSEGDIVISSADNISIEGDSDAAHQIDIATASSGTVTLNIATATAGNILNIATDDTTADDINIGSAKDDVDITGASQIVAGTTDPLTITAHDSSTWSMSVTDGSDKTLIISAANAGAGDGLISVGADGDITLDTSGGTLYLNETNDRAINTGTGDFTFDTTGSILADSATTVSFDAVTDLDLGTSNAARNIAIGTGTGIDTINIGTGGTATDVIVIGDSVASLALTDADWSITTAGIITTTGLSNLNGGIAVDTNNFTVSGTTGAVAILGDMTAGNALDIGFDADNQSGAMVGVDIDFTNITNDNANNIYGARIKDFTLGAGLGGNLYGLYVQGTNWDYGAYFEDDVYMDAGLTIDGHLLPNQDNTFDLGSPTARWQDIYLGPASLNIYNQNDDTDYDAITLGFESNIATLRSTKGGTGTARDLHILTGTGSGPGLYIDTNNYVGIGTAGPSSKLDVTTNSLGVTQTNTSGLALVNTTAAALDAQQISPALRWRGHGWKTDAVAASQSVDFRSYVVPVQGASAPTGYLAFESSINEGAYSATPPFVITSGGNIGIGTTGPGGKLEVYDSGSTQLLHAENAHGHFTAKGYSTEIFQDGGTYGNPTLHLLDNDNSVDRAIIHAQGNGGAIEALWVATNGNVGIGTTGPGYKLDVSGGGSVGITNKTAAPTNSQSLPGSLDFDGYGWNTRVGSEPIKGQILLSGAYVEPSGSVEPYFAFSLKGTGGNANPTQPGPSTLTEVMRITNYGNVGIGTTVPAQKLDVNGRIVMRTWTSDGDTVAYRDTATNSIALIASDIRLKKNITPLTGALDIVSQINAYKYNDADEEDGAKQRLGIMAQEVLPILPELTFEFTNDASEEVYYGVHYDKLPVLLLEAIKEQQEQIDHVKADLLEATSAHVAGELRLEIADLSASDGNVPPSDPFDWRSGSEEGLGAEPVITRSGSLGEQTADGEVTEFYVRTIRAKEVEADTGIFQKLTVTIEAIFDHVKAQTLNVAGEITAKVARIGRAIVQYLEVEEAKISQLTAEHANVSELKANSSESEKAKIGELTVDKIRIADKSAISGGNAGKPATSDATIGSVTIPAGKTSIPITNSLITDHSKVFTTTSEPVPIGIKKTPGSGFTLKLAEPLTEDLTVDWWIVN